MVTTTPRRWYRVLHRDNGRVRVLGRLPDVTPHVATLDPFHSRLLLDGIWSGELLLIDETRRRIVARRPVLPPSPGGE